MLHKGIDKSDVTGYIFTTFVIILLGIRNSAGSNTLLPHLPHHCLMQWWGRFLSILSTVLLACSATEVRAEATDEYLPFAMTLEELSEWQAGGTLAYPENVSRVPLATRFVDTESRYERGLNTQVRVLIAPDGIGAAGNYIEEQQRFNLYNFTHWSQVDILNWFGGTSERSLNIPSRPWVEAAHRHGVKVIGTVFLAPTAWGGRADMARKLTVSDDDGHFPLAGKLVRIAEYYGFDGWLINQETDLREHLDDESAAEAAAEYLAFMTYLTGIRPEGMEIHWYDSMLADGRVDWQNELNSRNLVFLQDGARRSSDAIFLNYYWNRRMIQDGAAIAEKAGRSRFDVYVGADLWPGRKAQALAWERKWLQALFEDDDGLLSSPLGSVALFANNYVYSYSGSQAIPASSDFINDSDDVESFYRGANQLFGGIDENAATADADDDWPGIGRYVPARSSITALPFSTNFTTGHGKIFAMRGVTEPRDWHDLSRQDHMPTWQFAVTGNQSTRLAFDFDHAYEGGNSLRISGDPRLGASDVPLYKVRLDVGKKTRFSVVYKSALPTTDICAWLLFSNGERVCLDMVVDEAGWNEASTSLSAYAGRTISRIGLSLSQGDTEFFEAHIGELRLYDTAADD